MNRLEHDRFDSNDARAKRRRAGFLRSEDGSLIIFGLMMFLMMIIVAGMSVDFMRFETQRTRLQSTLDRAILAAASMDQTLDPELVVLDYFEKAGLGNFIDASMIDVYENERLVDDTWSGADQESLTSRRVEAEAGMTIGTTFLKFSGIDSLGAPAAGSAEESASQTEISLVLDVSGSMGWDSDSGNSKIYELRKAAKKFINIVLCDPAYPDRTSPCVVEEGKVSVSIVPYAEQVLVGETLLGYFNATSEHDYSSCVHFDASDFNATGISDAQLLQRAGHFDPWSNDDAAGPDYNRTCNPQSWREITAVSGNASILRDAIDDLDDGGNTSIDVGMKWGTAFLDPAAQPVVEDLIAAGSTDEDYEGRPLDYDTSRASKVIVLMTDGVNTDQHYLYDEFRSGASPIYYFQCEDDDPCDGDGPIISIYRESTGKYYWEQYNTWEDHAYGDGTYEECHREWVRTGRNSGYYRTVCEEVEESSDEDRNAVQLTYPEVWAMFSWEWWDDFSWLNTPGNDYGNSTKNGRLEDICDAAKDEDHQITVFTIGFEVTTSSAAVMKNCASTDAHYFDADGLDLSSAFAAIAREISKLRLTN